MSGESTVTIGLLLPDVLGTYSDAGNATILAQRLRWRGIPAEIRTITACDVPATSCSVYLLGGGEDTAQQFAADWLRRHEQLRRALETSAVTLAVCAGLQILGRSMSDASGHHYPGLDLLDITTAPGRHRAVGEVIVTCAVPDVGSLTGFENHRGVTTLGPGTAPLGRVITGTGNGTGNGTGEGTTRCRTEGVFTDRIIGTYLHGPVLARNPALADYILHQATGQALAPLDLPDQAALRDTYLGHAYLGYAYRQGRFSRCG
ncbi:MAG TPA: glutamine amidotransferase [Pseudonocardiaceae bacterium]|nr:glutamine amidotransferase [Pseudonocardiaceae bacterium]